MNIQDVAVEEKPLSGVKHIRARIVYEGGTPKKSDVRQVVADAAKTKAETTVVEHIYTDYGSSVSDVEAVFYPDEKMMKAVENESMLKKNGIIKEEKKEGEGGDAPAEAAPAEGGEEKSEEAPAEEKKEEAAEEKPAEEEKKEE